MKLFAIALSALALTAVETSSAQTQHETHDSGSTQHGSAGTAAPSPHMGMMENMPEQCRAIMANMPKNCMSAMQEMMQGGMMQGHGSAQGAVASSGAELEQSEATKAYEAAIERMHQPMAEGIKADDPDVAFVRGMIPHHQSAIDMAKVVQEYGEDDQTKKWAAEIIAAQEREIAEMQEWLEKNAR